MFDFRYHVVSLAAVFLALVIGILVGAGISQRGGLRDVERDRLNNKIARLEDNLDAASAHNAVQDAAGDLAGGGWKALVARRLEGKRVAVVFVGPVDGDARTSVEDTVREAGGRVTRLRAVGVPIATQDVEEALRSRRALRGYVGPDQLGSLGHDLGTELVDGGETPLWDALSDILVEESGPDSGGPVDAVVISRTALPQQGETGRFVKGLYAGLMGAADETVGVETSTADISAVKAFRRAGISSVDDVDLPVGRVALAVLLAGGRPGQYGVKETRDRALPPIDPVAPTAGQ
jgi:hypothetical protein